MDEFDRIAHGACPRCEVDDRDWVLYENPNVW